MTWLKLTGSSCFLVIVSALIVYYNQEVPVDDFAKFQPHQTADDKFVIRFGLWFCNFFKSFWGLFDNAFEVSFKLRFFKLNFFCMVDK